MELSKFFYVQQKYILDVAKISINNSGGKNAKHHFLVKNLQTHIYIYISLISYGIVMDCGYMVKQEALNDCLAMLTTERLLHQRHYIIN